jgi:hypothetical protein
MTPTVKVITVKLRITSGRGKSTVRNETNSASNTSRVKTASTKKNSRVRMTSVK